MTTNKSARNLRLALLASSNLDLLQAPLIAQLIKRGFSPTVWNPGFDQYRQAILDPHSALYGNGTECVILFLDAADLFAEYLASFTEHGIEDVEKAVSRVASEVSSLVHTINLRLPSATIFLNTLFGDVSGTYYGMEYNSEFTFRQILSSYNAKLKELTHTSPSAVVVDVEMLAAFTGLERWYDPRMWYLGRIRYGAEAHKVLANEYANFISARWGNVRKCVVLDLDNTLWGGIVGEDGVAGIQLGEEGIGLAFVEFQRDLQNLREKGILLAICSKNNPEDAYAVIRNHPAMILREEHFVAAQINWNDKADNIREIARRLNLGLDSLVFIDDNPVESQRVRDAIPEVAVPEWPHDPCDYKRALFRVVGEYFLKFDVTEDDGRRGEMYHAQTKREQLAESVASLEDFYRSLQMKLTIGAVDHETLPRVSQLTQKTNQFNLTTRRYTESELAAMSADIGCRVYCLKLEDRFGPNGIVSVIILRRQRAEQWEIDTFLLSCRVIGRTVEEAFLGYVVRDLQKLGATCIMGEYIPTTKNRMVATLYDKLGFTRTDGYEDQTKWALDLNQRSITVPEWFEFTDQERISAQ